MRNAVSERAHREPSTDATYHLIDALEITTPAFLTCAIFSFGVPAPFHAEATHDAIVDVSRMIPWQPSMNSPRLLRSHVVTN